ncbi:MAG: response regulator [Pseudomonas sp.]|nr:response regulator [Pseudomonas sp.]
MAHVDWNGMLPINGEIVVVEDDDILRPLMVDILSEIRAKTVAFRTADDALGYVLESHGHCSVLITDHGLPGQINGTKLADMLRAKWPEIEVILTSGYELDPGTLPSGVTYLQKPWTVTQLIETVGLLLQPGKPVTAV